MLKPRKKKKIHTDIYSKRKRSQIMGAVKGKGTLLEISFGKILTNAGLRFSRNVSRLPGKPDIVFRKKEVVVFLDGCFWHGCKKHFKLPKSNQLFWQPKIERNIVRDAQISKFYRSMGWIVLRFWEHQIKTKPELILKKIKNYV